MKGASFRMWRLERGFKSELRQIGKHLILSGAYGHTEIKAKGLEDNLAFVRYTLELRNERPQAELLLRYQYGVKTMLSLVQGSKFRV